MADLSGFVENGGIRNWVDTKIEENFKKSDKQIIGIGSFTAYVAVAETELLESGIPDVVLEDGSTVSDTIFLRPMILSIDGEVADVHIKDQKSEAFYAAANNVISQVTPYLPNRINSELDKIQTLGDTLRNAYAGINDAIAKGDQVLNIFQNNSNSKTNQEKFIEEMRRLYKSRETFSVETATGLHNNMAIESVEFSTSNIDKRVSFKLSLKQVRKAKIKRFRFAPKPSSGLKGQTEKKVNKGVEQGEAASSSILSRINSFFSG